MNGSLVSDNVADQNGGGIYKRGGTLSLISSSISSNQSNAMNGAAGGGGIFNQQTLNITNSAVSDNYTAGIGGGVYTVASFSLNADVNILNSTISGNGAGMIGGCFL